MPTKPFRLRRGRDAAVIGVTLAVASVSAGAALPAAWGGQTGGTATATRTSSSWSGYVASSRSPFTSVSAEWTVAAVSCARSTATQAAVQWVGFDGWTDRTVEQSGTEAYCSGTTPMYSAWWEMYPTSQIRQVFAVRPGDVISASISFANRTFRIVVRDRSSGKSLNIAAACTGRVPCNRSSAEWIVEAPDYDGRGSSLARWNQVSFTNTLASVSRTLRPMAGIAAFTNIRVTMTGAHGHRAQPGSLASGGLGFAEGWISAT